MPTNVVKTKTDEKHWNHAKEIASQEKPELKGDEYYAYTMGVYKKMNKHASNDEIVEALYAEGVLSKIAVDSYYEDKQYNDILSELGKEASLKDSIKNFAKTDIGKGVATGAGLAIGGTAIMGASKGLNAIKSHLLRNKRLKEVHKFEPSIRDMDPALVKATMKDIERLNPEYASSPLITGSILKSVHSWGGLGVDQANMIKDKDRQRTVTDLFLEGFKARPKEEKKKEEMGFKKASEEKDASSFSERMRNGWNEGKSSVANTLKNPTFQTVAMIGAGTAGIAAASKLVNNMTRNKRLSEMKSLYPELQKHEDSKLKRALLSVEHINPAFGRDSYVAGGYVAKFLKDKGVKPSTAQGLAESRNNMNVQRPFVSAKSLFGKGD